ncbi:Protein unc-93 A [Chamberlinius hualienensis]
MTHTEVLYDTENESHPLLQESNSSNPSKKSLPLKWKIWINIVLISLSYGLANMNTAAISTVQSSINYKDSLGSSSLASLTIGSLIGSLFFNSIYKKLGNKVCMIIGSASNLLYILSNLYPTWYTMIPSGFLSGFFGSFLFITIKIIFAQMAQNYCQSQNQDDKVDKVQTRMFMINILLYKASIAAFLPVTSIILGVNDKQPTESNKENFMDNTTVFHCGSEYCNEGFGKMINLTAIDNSVTDFKSVFKLVMFCIGIWTIAIAILFFAYFPKSNDCHKKIKTFPISLMTKPRIIMLIPSFMIIMAGDAFWSIDFVSAFITCPIGIEYIGLVMMWTGMSGAMSSLIFGSFNSETFRKVPIILASLIQLIILMVLFVWPMENNVFLISCILTAGWYIGSGIRLTLLPALIAVVFPDDLESTFSVMHLWMFLGAFLITIWSGWLCMSTKIIITMTIITTSLIGYICLEISIYREKHQTLGTTETVKSNVKLTSYKSVRNICCK